MVETPCLFQGERGNAQGRQGDMCLGEGGAEGDEQNRKSHSPEVIIVTMQEKGRGERRGAAIVGFRGSRRRLEKKSGRSKVLLLGEGRVAKEDEVTSVGPRAHTR